MNNNIVQYRIPQCTELVFLIPPQERYLSMKLLDGSAIIEFNDDPKYLQLGIEYVLPLWGNLNSRLKTITGCEITVKGNHYVYSAMTVIEGACKNLFGVSFIEDSYVFFLDGCTQLQILVDESATLSDVYLKLIRGAAEVFGYSMALDTKYSVLCSSPIVRSENMEPFTLCIEGKARRIKISLLDDESLAFKNSIHVRLHELRLRAKKNETEGPVVLVVGPTNVGKTSFCRFLANKALENNTYPAYIDLDVQRSTCSFPGAISLVEPEAKHSSAAGFSFSEKTELYFGSLNFTTCNIRLYHHLVRRMGEILSRNRSPGEKFYSGAIIDMCGALGQDGSTIKCVLQSYPINMVVVIGDKRLCDDMKKDSLLPNVEYEFIPEPPQNMEPPNKYRESKMRDKFLEIYFHHLFFIDKPIFLRNFQASFSDFKIYRIDLCVHGNPAVVKMPCLSIVNCVLGVSEFANVDETLAIAEVKYFVIFTRIHFEKKAVDVLSPMCERLKGEILILGDVKMIEH